MVANEQSTEGSIEKILKRRALKRHDVDIPTGVIGITLRGEKGSTPNVSKKILGKLATAGSRYQRFKELREVLDAGQQGPASFIKNFFQQHEKLRGLKSIRHNLGLSVYPKGSIIKYHREPLQRSLGASYSAIVNEVIHASVSVPPDYETDEGPLNSELLNLALIRGLGSLGLSEEQIGSLAKIETIPVPNEEILRPLVASGQVELDPEVAETEETWVIRTRRLN